MTTSRKKLGVAFWATVVVVVGLVGYPVSFGPACWIGWPRYLSLDDISRAYQPILWVSHRSPRPVQDGISWYISLANCKGSWFTLREGRILKTVGK